MFNKDSWLIKRTKNVFQSPYNVWLAPVFLVF